MTPTEIVVHHSAGEDRPGLDAAGIRRYHREERGYLDIGYHALVEMVDGEPFALIGRPWHWPGAHCKGHNDRALGIAFVGNYSVDELPDALFHAGYNTIRTWMRLFAIPPERIFRHSDLAATECPGLLFPWARLLKLCGGKA